MTSKIITKLSSKNQITIPVKFIDELKFSPQARLSLKIIDGKLVIEESVSAAKFARGWAKKYIPAGVDTSTWPSEIHKMRNIERAKWNQ